MGHASQVKGRISRKADLLTVLIEAGTFFVFRTALANGGQMDSRFRLNILSSFARTPRKSVPAMVSALMCLRICVGTPDEPTRDRIYLLAQSVSDYGWCSVRMMGKPWLGARSRESLA